MTSRLRCAAVGLALVSALTLSSCSVLDRASGVSSPSSTPQVSPSVWVSQGKHDDVLSATAHLLRLSDLDKTFRAAPLTLGTSDDGVKPVACAALMGPALGVVFKARGRASTSFTSTDGRTAVAQTVAVYPSPAAASAVLAHASALGKKCKSMTAFGQKLTVKVARTTVSSLPAVAMTQRQKTGAESITVIVSAEFVSVVAIASLLPGPSDDLVTATVTAAAARLAPTP